MTKRILLTALLIVPVGMTRTMDQCENIQDETKGSQQGTKSERARNDILSKSPQELDRIYGRNGKIELLNYFAYKGDVDAVKKLLTVRAKCNAKDLNTPNLMNITVWQSAQEGGNEEIKNLLIAAGAKTDIAPTALPALHKAVYYGDKDAVKQLVNQQALNQAIDFKGGITPLYIALWTGNPEMYQLLLQSGADKDFGGGSAKDKLAPLYTAARFGHAHVVKYLLDNKLANPNQASGKLYTPLSVAARKGHNEALELLLQAGADANQLAVDKDANVPRGQEQAETPLAIAEKAGNTEGANLLRQYGAQ